MENKELETKQETEDTVAPIPDKSDKENKSVKKISFEEIRERNRKRAERLAKERADKNNDVLKSYGIK